MSLIQLFIALLGVFVLSRFILAPLAGRCPDGIQSVREVGRVAWHALFRFISNLSFWSLLSVGIIGIAQYFINQTGGIDVDTVSRSHATLEEIKTALTFANDGLARAVAAALGAGLAIWTFVQVRRRGRQLLRGAYEQEIERLFEAKAEGHWEERPPDEGMQEVEKRIEAAAAAVAAREEREDDPERYPLQQELASLLALHELLDVQRRVEVKIDPMDLGPSKPSGFGHRIATLFVSEGLVRTLGGAGRLVAIGLSLLLIPTLLALSAAPIADAADRRQVQLTEHLHRLELQLAVDNLQQEFDATLERAVEAEQAEQQHLEHSEEERTEPETLNAGDLQVVRHLARIFESEVFPNGLTGRIFSSAEPQYTRLIRRGLARQSVLRTAAGFVAPERASVRIEGVLESTPDRGEVARLLERNRQGPVTRVGARAEQRFSELARSQPSFWRGVRHMVQDYASSFNRAATPHQVRGLLVSQAIGEAFDTVQAKGALADLVKKSVANAADNAGKLVFETQYQRFVVEMGKTRSLKEAIAASVDRRVPMFTAAETARFHAAAREFPDQRALAEALERRPPSLTRGPGPKVNANRAQQTVGRIATRLHGGQPPANFADALSSFADYFPGIEGEERRTQRYQAQRQANVLRTSQSVQNTASRRNFTRARSYVRLRGFARVGGVLLGRMPEGGEAAAIRDLSWSVSDDQLVLELQAADGRTHVLGPYPAAIAHLALAYAADGRPTTVTMVHADPLPELKILLHPALVDTPLGCRATRLDQFVDEFTGMSEELAALRAAAIREVEAQIALYRYVWAVRLQTLLNGETNRMLALPPGFSEVLGPQAGEIIGDLPAREAVEEILDAGVDVQSLEDKPEFFDHRIAGHIEACRTVDDLGRFKTCIERDVVELAGLYIDDRTSSWGAPPPSYNIWSGVREQHYSLDPDFDFVAHAAKPPLWPLDFMVQVAFTSPPWFAPSDAPWYDEGNVALENYVDLNPLEIDAIRDTLYDVIEEAAGAAPGDTWHEHASIISDMRDFAILQRLFRLAFEGYFGDKFPLEKLTMLAEVTGALLPPATRTLRWNPRTGALEYALLEELSLVDGELDTQPAIAACRQWLSALAEEGALALAVAPQEAWEEHCALESTNLTPLPVADFAARVTLIRRLRHDLGVPVDDRLVAERQICPAAF